MRGGRWVRVALAATAVWGGPVVAQEADALNVFLDCSQPGCDFDFFRREISVVNWVRDREAATVHILVTSRVNGGGGRTYELAFIGRGDREGLDTDLAWSSPGGAVADELRGGIAARIKLGLVGYLLGTPAEDLIRVEMGLPIGRPSRPGNLQAGDGEDPWDHWVFRLGANGFGFGESTLTDRNYSGSVDADRVTEDWKLNLGANLRRSQQTYELEDTTVRETRRDWGVEAALVRSVGRQWAVGLRADAGSSSFYNQDLRWGLQPGVEYDVFPYSESSRRALTFQYLVGPQHWDYAEETIFGKTDETRWRQSLIASLALNQPWGRWSTSARGQQFLHDTAKYSVTLSGSLNVRLFQGFSIRVSGNYSWIRDQLYLSGEGATNEQILLRQRQLETSFRYFTSFGIEYRFGSIFNNIVNPRFGGSNSEFFF